jgi:hypothetical protein
LRERVLLLIMILLLFKRWKRDCLPSMPRALHQPCQVEF